MSLDYRPASECPVYSMQCHIKSCKESLHICSGHVVIHDLARSEEVSLRLAFYLSRHYHTSTDKRNGIGKLEVKVLESGGFQKFLRKN